MCKDWEFMDNEYIYRYIQTINMVKGWKMDKVLSMSAGIGHLI
jgi:hypothetical protein